MRSDSVYLVIILGLLGAFGGTGLTVKFLEAKNQTERVESFINDDELSVSQKAILLQIVNLPKEQSGDPTESLHQLFSKLGREYYVKSMDFRASDPKKAAYFDLAGGYFLSAAQGLKNKSRDDQTLRILADLKLAFQALESADEPVNLPVNQPVQELKEPAGSPTLAIVVALLGFGTAGLGTVKAWYDFKGARQKLAEPSKVA